MVKAEELIKKQKEKEDKKYITFEKIYKKIEKKISIASSCDYYYTWYQVPEFLIGLPLYSFNECNEYVQTKLKKNGFDIEFYSPNLLLIKWFPK